MCVRIENIHYKNPWHSFLKIIRRETNFRELALLDIRRVFLSTLCFGRIIVELNFVNYQTINYGIITVTIIIFITIITVLLFFTVVLLNYC